MKIGIIGATGHVGQVVTQEALNRGHEVTALVHNAARAQEMFGDKVNVVAKDALALTAGDLASLDVVVDAFASPKVYQHLDLAAHLVSLFRGDDKKRLVFVIGSSTLHNDKGEVLLDETLKRFAGEPWIAAPIQQGHEFQFLQWADDVNWTVISPSTDFVDGPKTDYKTGNNTVITSADGKTEVNMGNFAAAMLDEIEQPKHNHEQFDVVNA